MGDLHLFVNNTSETYSVSWIAGQILSIDPRRNENVFSMSRERTRERKESTQKRTKAHRNLDETLLATKEKRLQEENKCSSWTLYLFPSLFCLSERQKKCSYLRIWVRRVLRTWWRPCPWGRCWVHWNLSCRPGTLVRRRCRPWSYDPRNSLSPWQTHNTCFLAFSVLLMKVSRTLPACTTVLDWIT